MGIEPETSSTLPVIVMYVYGISNYDQNFFVDFFMLTVGNIREPSVLGKKGVYNINEISNILHKALKTKKVYMKNVLFKGLLLT